MNHQPHCIYCQLSSHPSLIYESDFALAVLDPENFRTGEVLVMTRDHTAQFTEMLDLEIRAVMEATVQLARAIRSATACKGIRLEQVEPADHYRVRLIPLFNNHDVFRVDHPEKYIQAVRATLYAEIS